MPRRKSKAGRPSLGDSARSIPVVVKLSPREHVAIQERVARENAEVDATPGANAADRKPATVSSWIRDHALDPLGLADFRTRTGDE